MSGYWVLKYHERALSPKECLRVEVERFELYKGKVVMDPQSVYNKAYSEVKANPLIWC